MSLTPGQSLFSTRADLLLVEEMNKLSGVAKLLNAESAAKLRVFYSEFSDVSRDTLKQFKETTEKGLSKSGLNLIDIFWNEFSGEVKLIDAKARLFVGQPVKIDPCATCHFNVDPETGDTSEFSLMPFVINGTQRGVFDDVAIFDIPQSWIAGEVIDLSSIERFLSLGTTISFYVPGPAHQRWYSYAKAHAFPPQIRCNKKLTLLFNANVGTNTVAMTFGVDSSDGVDRNANRVAQ